MKKRIVIFKAKFKTDEEVDDDEDEAAEEELGSEDSEDDEVTVRDYLSTLHLLYKKDYFAGR